MGKLKDRLNKFMKPATGTKSKEFTEYGTPVTASRSLRDSAEQEVGSISKTYK